jgi:putative ABC transport system permease protein
VRAYLRSGVTLRQARAEVDALSARLRDRYPAENAGLRISLLPERRTRPLIDASDLMPIVGSMLIGLGIIVLANTCGSVMGLVLARSTERQKEISLRLALGASARQVLSHAVLESLLVALAGGLVAWFVVGWAADLISVQVSLSSGFRFDVQTDNTVLAFTLLLATLAGITVGSIPALAATRSDIRSNLLGHGATTDSRRTRARARVVVVQFALVTVLLVTAGLFVGGARVAADTELGFATDHRLLVGVSPRDNGYDERRGRQIFDDVLARAASLPGVRSATIVQDVPLGASSSSIEVRAHDQPADAPLRRISYNVVGPNYFEAIGIPLARGRTFDAPGALTGNPAIVNERLAAMYWPGQDPIGKEIVVVREGTADGRYEVIGVARDAKYNSIREAPRAYIYLPYAQHYRSDMVLVMHTRLDPTAMVPAARAMIREVDPLLEPTTISTLQASIALNALGSIRVGAGLLSVFGTLGMALAVLGMFGLLSYTTRLQHREIGIRMALGATPLRVMRHLLTRSLELAGRGVTAGLAFSVAIAVLLRGSVFGIGSLSAAPFVVIPALLAGLALVAGYLPARRVLIGNPMLALRHE